MSDMEKKAYSYLISYDLTKKDVNPETMEYLKESKSKYDKFEDEIYAMYNKISFDKGELPNTTICIQTDIDNPEIISENINKKLGKKYKLKRMVVVRYDEIYGGVNP
jgi:hypothetical protein